MNRRRYLSTSGIAFAGMVGVLGTGWARTDATAKQPGETGLRGRGSDGTTDQSDSSRQPVRTNYSGSGHGTVECAPISLDGPTVFLIEGGEDLTLTVFDATGVAVDELDNWAGLAVTNLDPGTYRFEVESEGDWTITVIETPVYDSDVETTLPVQVEGKSSDVYGPFDFSGERTLAYSATGDGRTVLSLQTSTGETFYTPVNGPGPIDTSIRVNIEETPVWVSVYVTSGVYSVSITA